MLPICGGGGDGMRGRLGVQNSVGAVLVLCDGGGGDGGGDAHDTPAVMVRRR